MRRDILTGDLRVLYIIIIPISALLFTLLTGSLQPYSRYDYGFPFTWKSLIWMGCVPCVQGGQCCSPTSYNWLFFALDLGFYSALGYTILIGYYSIRPPLRRESDPTDR